MESENRYRELASKWLNNTINSEERVEFARWYNEGQENRVKIPEDFAMDEETLKNRIYSSVDRSISRSHHRRVIRRLRRYAAVAAVFLMVVSAGFYFYHLIYERDYKVVLADQPNNTGLSEPDEGFEESSLLPSPTLTAANDISPGGDKAILTLGDGSQIILDDVQEGIVASQGGNSILKTAEGELVYRFAGEEEPIFPPAEIELTNFNTIETPKGGKFQIILPDGSKVWLNAASSLRFPAAFNGSLRQVELKGEAYFEVSPDESRIFEVITRDQRVKVLGTHFNINAYADEPSVNTTLLEGSVQISDLRTNNSKLLKPGEQAQLGEKMEVVSIGNGTEAVAWKDGYFQFNDADIQAVMRQIERWYDVEVTYAPDFEPVKRFGGEIERSLSLVQVLKILEKSKVHFRIEGREVMVMR
jgi:transmembrane sensor